MRRRAGIAISSHSVSVSSRASCAPAIGREAIQRLLCAVLPDRRPGHAAQPPAPSARASKDFRAGRTGGPIALVAARVDFGKERKHLLAHLVLELVHHAGAGQEAFGFQTVRPDDLVTVEEKVEILHRATFEDPYGTIIYKIFRSDQHLVLPEHQFGHPVREQRHGAAARRRDGGENPEGARLDHDRRETPRGRHSARPQPAQGLRSVIARVDQVARRQCPRPAFPRPASGSSFRGQSTARRSPTTKAVSVMPEASSTV